MQPHRTEQSVNTSDKVVVLICNKLHVKSDFLYPETTFEELGLHNEKEKEELVTYIAERFLLPTEGRLLNFIVNGAYIKDNFMGHLKKRIKTMQDVIKLIEGNDGWNGKPAAYNI